MRAAVGLILLCFSSLALPACAQSRDKTDSFPGIASFDNFDSKSDTVRALQNLFQRKRRSTRVKVGIVGLMIDALLIRSWTRSYERPNGNLPAPVAAMTVVGSGSSIPTSSYVAVGVATGLIVEILTQHKYGQKKLKAVLDDCGTGKPIPKKVRSKLTPKDFD